MNKKLALIVVLAMLIAAFFLFDLQQYLAFDAVKSRVDSFSSWWAAEPLLVGGGFFVTYVLVVALSLPGAAVMTLAAGALFGLLWGTLIVSFASSIGALLAFLIARYVLRDFVQSRFGRRLSAINEGIESEGAFYLFTLRLVPLFPFFLINLVMGLTRMPARTFYVVSQVGMLAGTLVYVNAGTQLAQLDGISGILSPALVFSFALLGLFPLLAKKFSDFLKARRVYRQWSKPARFDRNLVVIGAGAGGLVASYIGATVKASVSLVEHQQMGGDCLNYGCVPSKALIRSAKLAHQIRHAERYGLNLIEGNDDNTALSFGRVMQRVDDVVRAIAPHDSVERYRELGVDVVQGYARIVDPWTVEVALNEGGTRRLTARSIVIAAGARPFVPPLPGIEDVGYVTSDTLWQAFSGLKRAPERLVLLGGGPIGCELAQSFARLGSQVIQIEMLPRLLLREDEDVAALVQVALERDGVQVLVGHKAVRCERDGEHKYIVVEHDERESRIEFDELICAVGRSARLEGYGLEQLGIETQRTVVTNDYLETLYPNIYAAGDVAGPYQFTHTASHQAWYASVNALFGHLKRFKVDYRVIPWVTFTDPEVARVGLNRLEAQAQGVSYEETRYALDDLDRAITDSAAEGFISVLTVPGKDRILGATLVGEHAGELLAEFVLAMKHGIGLNKLLGTIHSYPTWVEANKYVAGEWKKAHAPQQALVWLERYHRWRRG